MSGMVLLLNSVPSCKLVSVHEEKHVLGVGIKMHGDWKSPLLGRVHIPTPC